MADLMKLPAPWRPLISVVIACFNQGDVLGLTLHSFLEQRFSHENYELLVVDDHSSDMTARAVVGEYRRKYPMATIDYIRHYRPNGGKYGASARVKNIGLRFARGKYVYFNNSEILQAGQSLEYIYQRMESSETSLCLRGRVIDLPCGELEGLNQEELETLHDRTDRQRERVASAPHAGLAAVLREQLLQVGGNDERFDYWGKEDLDLAARLKRLGLSYVYDENLKSFHIYHPANHRKEGDYLRMCGLLEENNRLELVQANVGQPWGCYTPIPDRLLEKTIILEADGRLPELRARLEALVYGSADAQYEILVVCRASDRAQVEFLAGQHFRALKIIVLADEPAAGTGARVLDHVRSPYIGFVPVNGFPAQTHLQGLPAHEKSILPWLTDLPLPMETARAQDTRVRGWFWDTETARGYLAESQSLEEWRLFSLVAENRNAGYPVISSPAIISALDLPTKPRETSERTEHRGYTTPLNRHSKIMAIVPHFRCEEWLSQCLQSLESQTRPVDAIVVVDDGSSEPPLAILAQFPRVTLLAMTENVGPYRIIQQVIDSSDFDGYLFQDADDWSSADRLACLLQEAEHRGAELIGSQELRVLCQGRELQPVCFPLDVNLALREKPGHGLLHPTSLVSRALVQRLGGFATGMRFGGDTEFLLRAVHEARIVNIPQFCYFRRHRLFSLTTHPEMGLDSPQRKELNHVLKERAYANNARLTRGEPPQLEPLTTRPEVLWKHITGPVFPGRI